MAAYNEELILEQKVNNTLALDYPVEKLNIIFITDGSTDDSVSIIRRFSGVTLLHKDERMGKYAAIKRAMREVRTPVVVFSDANTILNSDCINKIVDHYKNPVIGGVAGEKKILANPEVGAVGQAEGIYWQYESFLKRLDAGFYTVVGAAGELFSIRTRLFKEMDDQIILDDFVISMQVCLQGYRIAYEPGAYATETASSSLREEEKRKIRISAGAYQSVGYLKSCLNIFKYDDRDVHDPVAWKDQVLCSEPERAAFRALVALGLVDSFRLFDQPPATFSWWDYRMLGFQKNKGLRIDHVLLSAALAGRCTGCAVDRAPRKLERPSDHAPVIAEFTLP